VRRFIVTVWRIRRDDEDDFRPVLHLHLAHVQLTDVAALIIGVTLNVAGDVIGDDEVGLFLFVEVDGEAVAEELVNDLLGGELVVVVDERARQRTVFKEILKSKKDYLLMLFMLFKLNNVL
jgi:hypothetical protein